MIQFKRHRKEKNRIKKLNRAIETVFVCINAWWRIVWKWCLRKVREFLSFRNISSLDLWKLCKKASMSNFLGRQHLTRSLLRLTAKFNEHRTVHNLPHDRTKTVLTSQTVAVVGEKLSANPGPSSTCSGGRGVIVWNCTPCNYRVENSSVSSLCCSRIETSRFWKASNVLQMVFRLHWIVSERTSQHSLLRRSLVFIKWIHKQPE